MLRKLLDQVVEPLFAKGKPLHFLYPLYDATDTFLYSPGHRTKGTVHCRDSLEFKRLMTMVLIALGPCILMALWNTGYQANLAITQMGAEPLDNWRTWLLNQISIDGFDPFSPTNPIACMLHGALYFFPIYIVTFVVGIAWEVLFASVRGHEVNEGFFVTAMLFPLILPAAVPLWQVAVAISFGVVLGKEVFGGTGRNFLNPALTARAFMFFAYSQSVCGGLGVWVAAKLPTVLPDGISGATPLDSAMQTGVYGLGAVEWLWSLVGVIPGAMGETSVLACLFGAAFLTIVGVASWRIMASMLAGAVAVSLLFNAFATDPSSAFAVGPHWHIVLGGFAFGLVFMATDPVTAAMSRTGQYYYGALIGSMVVLVRVLNPAYPECVMLVILFGNVCAPLIDHYVVKSNIKRREARTAA